MASWLVDLPPDQAALGSSPGREHCVVFLGKTLSQCLSPPRCIHGTGEFSAVGNPRWTSIPSRGNRNTASRLMLQKQDISAGQMGILPRVQT